MPNETRAVLIVDVRRPLPTAPDLVNRFFLDVVGRHTYGRAVARKAEAFAAGKSTAAPQAAVACDAGDGIDRTKLLWLTE